MNKKLLISLSLSLMISLSIFAQKSELKVAEKAVKKKDYTTALAAVTQAETLIGNADAKIQAKFYYLKGISLYAEGAKKENIDEVISSFNTLKAVEKKSGAQKYSNEASAIINKIIEEIDADAYAAYIDGQKNKDNASYKKAADGYAKIYKLRPTDSLYLYNSAVINAVAKEYEKSNTQYQELLDLGYTGIATTYTATSTVNGETRIYNSSKEMMSEVKLKIAENPQTKISDSKYIAMIKAIGVNYLALENNEKALEFIKKARVENPKDYNLIIEEGNIYFNMGDNAKFKEKLEEAIEINPNNPQLYYNVGILNSEIGDNESAIKNLKKTIELDPKHADAYNALGNIILTKADVVLKKMDQNAMNFKKYDEIKDNEYSPILKEALPYLEKSYELKSDEAIRKQLNSIYENLGMDKRIE